MEMPVTGKRLVTTATLANTWKAKSVVMPTTIRAPNLSRAWRASQYPRMISRANTARIRQAPMRPNSSHTMAKIKSFWASGR